MGEMLSNVIRMAPGRDPYPSSETAPAPLSATTDGLEVICIGVRSPAGQRHSQQGGGVWELGDGCEELYAYDFLGGSHLLSSSFE